MPVLLKKTRPAVRTTLLAGAASLGLTAALTGAAGAAPLPVPSNTGAWSAASASTTGSTETVTVSANRAYAEWSEFNVSSGNTFAVSHQTSPNWILVNKVTGGTGSTISGNVTAAGQVWIIDPNGVTVNAGAALNVGGLLLSSAAWGASEKSNFLGGGTSWSFTGQNRSIVLNGTVTTSGGGVVALLGPSVVIGGTVNGSANTQVLAVAAKDVSLSFDDSGTYFTLSGVSIDRGANGGSVLISNGASVSADRIVVAAAGATSAASIVVSGGLTANAARGDGADIVLMAADGTGPDAIPTSQPILSGGAVAAIASPSVLSSVTLGATGALTASGAIVNSAGDIDLAGNISATTTTLTSAGGAIDQTAGVITALTLTGSSHGATSLTDANLVGTVSNFTTGGDFTLSNAAGLTANGVASSGGNVTLQTTAGDIAVTGALTTGAGETLTLDSYHAIAIRAPLTVPGAGQVVLTTNDGGTGGDYSFGLTSSGFAGSLSFTGGPGSGAGLTINGQAYTLLYSMTDVAGVSSDMSGHYALASPLDASGSTYTNAVIIGGNPFSGVFAGLGHTISNLKIVAPATDDIGLFQVVFNGTVRDVGLLGGSVSGQTAVGDLVGRDSNGTLQNVFATGGVTGAGHETGGLTGTADGGVISGAFTSGAVSGADQVGGLAGETNGATITNSYATGAVAGTYFVGGLLGYVPSTTVTGSYASGSVTGVGEVGGLIGSVSGGTISGSYATGAVTGNTNVGGLIGYSSGTSISDTYAMGSVTATGAGAAQIGGLVGGSQSGSISSSYATGYVSGAVGADALIGGAGTTTLANLYYNTDTAGVSSAYGTGLTTAQLQGALPTGFGAAWATGAGLYPYLVSFWDGAPQAISGTAYNSNATAAAGAQVGVYSNGGLLAGGYASTGANGAYYELVAGGTVGVSTAVGSTVTLAGASNPSGLTYTDQQTLAGGNVALAGVTAGTIAETTGQATLSGLASSLAATFGPAYTTISSQLAGAPTTIAGTSGSGLTLDQDLTAAGDLTLVAPNGTLNLGADVSAGATHNLTLANAVVIQADSTLTGSKVTATSTIDGAHALAITGNAEFDAALGGGTKLTSLSVSGTSLLKAGAVSTSGSQTYTGAVTLGAPTALTGSMVKFGSTLDGAYALTATATTSQLGFGGGVGQTTPLASLSGTGVSVGLGGPVATSGGLSLTSTGAALTIGSALTSTSGAIALSTTTIGDLGVSAALNASQSVSLNSAGKINQTGGIITATTLTGSAATSATLNDANAVGTLSSFTATTGLGFTNASGFSASGVNGGSATSLTASTGDLTLSGAIAGTTTTLTATTGKINQTGGIITATTLTGSAGTSATLNDANAVGTLSSFTASTGLGFTNATGFAATGVNGGSAASLTASTGDLTLSGAISGTITTLTATTGKINQTGGVITATTLTGSAATSATLNDANAVGTLSSFTASTGLGFTNATGYSASGVNGGSAASLTATTGDLTLSGAIGGTTTTLTATAGKITQTGGIITAATLQGSAQGAVTLNGANLIDTLGVFTNGGAGTFSLTDAKASGLTLSSALNMGAGDIDLTLSHAGTPLTLGVNLTTDSAHKVDLVSAGAINQTGGILTTGTLTGSAATSATLNDANAVGTLSTFTATTGLGFTNATGFAASGVNGGSAASLTATTGDLTLSGAIAGTTTTLTATTGKINQTGGVITATTLTGSAATSATLNDANAVGTLSSFTATTGLGLTNATGFAANGVTGGSATGLTATTGDLTLSGAVAGTTTTLTATTGKINQTGGIITATTLTGSAATSATLNDANAVGTLSSFTATTGLGFTNATGFAATGVNGGSAASLTASTGDLTLSGAIAGTTTTLTATTGKINQTGGIITATTLTGSSAGATILGTSATPIANQIGALSGFVSGGDFSLTDTGAGQSLTVNGALSSTHGAIYLATALDLNINAAISAANGLVTLSVGQDLNLNSGGSVLCGACGTDFGFAAGRDLNLNIALSGAHGVLSAGRDLNLAAGVTTTGVLQTTAGRTIAEASGGVIMAATLTGSSGGSTALGTLAAPVANKIGTLVAFNAGTGFSLTNAQSLAVTGADVASLGFTGVNAGTGALTLQTTAGDLTLQTATANLTAGAATGTQVVTLDAAGNLSQTGGILTGGVLTGASGGSTTLGTLASPVANQVGTLAAFSAGTGFSLTNARTLMVTGADVSGLGFTGVNAGTGALTLQTTTGDLTLQTATANLTAGAAGGSQIVTLASAGAINQSGGVITTGVLTGSSGGATALGTLAAPVANKIGTLAAFNTGTGFSLTNAQSLAVTGADVASLGFTGVNAGTGALTLQTTAGDLTLQSATANLTAGAAAGTQVVTLDAAGNLSQTGGILTGGVLTGASGGSTTLGTLASPVANKIGTLAAFSAGTGFSLTNARTLAVTGADVSGLGFTGVNAGTGALTVDVTSGDLNLQTATANLTAGAAGGSQVVTLDSAGAIGQGGGVITAATLTGSAGTSATLNDANAVGTLSSFTATTGLGFTNATGFTASGVNGGSATSLTASTGDLTLSGAVAGTTTTLTATTGKINQTGGIITATTLTGSAGTSATLNDANAVGTLSSFTASTGLGFTNATGFAASGVNGGSAASLTASTGDLTLSGAIAGTTTTLTATTGKINQTGGIITATTLTGSAATSATLNDANAVGTLSNFTATTQALSFTNATGFTASGVSAGTSMALNAGTGLISAGGLTASTQITLTSTDLDLTGAVKVTAGDLVVYARPDNTPTADPVYLGDSPTGATRPAGTGLWLNQSELARVTANALDLFAGVTSSASSTAVQNIEVGNVAFSSTLSTVRLYAGPASRVDIAGTVSGSGASTLVVGDAGTDASRSTALKALLTPGWTPATINVNGAIGVNPTTGASQPLGRVALAANDIVIVPSDASTAFAATIANSIPIDTLPAYAGKPHVQLAAAQLELRASDQIVQRNLSNVGSDLVHGVGLEVGTLTIDTVQVGSPQASQVVLFGQLSPKGQTLTGSAAAVSLTFGSATANVIYQPPATTLNKYHFNTCVFGGGACFVTATPYSVPPIPNPDQIGDLADPYAPTDEEPVVNAGGEVGWPAQKRVEHPK